MSKLLNADMSRILKARSLYFGMLISALLAAVFTILNKEDNSFASIPEGGALLILPVMIGSVIALNVSTEFTSGAIRNKLIIGHSRVKILFSWAICFTIVTVLFFALYEGTAFAMANILSYDLSMLISGIVAKNLLLVFLLVLSNIFMGLFICIVVEDVRSVAIMFIMQFSFLLISTVVSEALEDNKTAELLFRFFPQGQLTYLNIFTAPDRPWLTVICAAITGTVMLLLSIVYFRKHDMK